MAVRREGGPLITPNPRVGANREALPAGPFFSWGFLLRACRGGCSTAWFHVRELLLGDRSPSHASPSFRFPLFHPPPPRPPPSLSRGRGLLPIASPSPYPMNERRKMVGIIPLVSPFQSFPGFRCRHLFLLLGLCGRRRRRPRTRHEGKRLAHALPSSGKATPCSTLTRPTRAGDHRTRKKKRKKKKASSTTSRKRHRKHVGFDAAERSTKRRWERRAGKDHKRGPCSTPLSSLGSHSTLL